VTGVLEVVGIGQAGHAVAAVTRIMIRMARIMAAAAGAAAGRVVVVMIALTRS
jgi:hypothetical protein